MLILCSVLCSWPGCSGVPGRSSASAPFHLPSNQLSTGSTAGFPDSQTTRLSSGWPPLRMEMVLIYPQRFSMAVFYAFLFLIPVKIFPSSTLQCTVLAMPGIEPLYIEPSSVLICRVDHQSNHHKTHRQKKTLLDSRY